MKVNRGLLRGLVVAAASAALIVPSAAFAQGGPPGGHGGGPPPGRGHGGGATEVSNNLSVPTIMVGGGSFTDVNCPTDSPAALVTPSGDPLTGYPIDPEAHYYVQGENSWQAQCFSASSASATAAWGDNLTGSARLTVGHPIRVELGLIESTDVSMLGYKVVKLDPNALDRESAYGTLATPTSTGGYEATPQTFPYTETVTDPETGQQVEVTNGVRVYDGEATFSIKNDSSGTYVVSEGTTATAEINATGAVVYGYNLRVPEAGQYTITFTVPNVTLTGTDAGTYDAAAHTTSVTITVPSGGGGVGRGGGAGGGHNGGG